LFEIFDLQFFYYPSSIFKDPLLWSHHADFDTESDNKSNQN
jgi:hypothetical protein